jgi:hypothetical protein
MWSQLKASWPLCAGGEVEKGRCSFTDECPPSLKNGTEALEKEITPQVWGGGWGGGGELRQGFEKPKQSSRQLMTRKLPG